MQQRIHVFAFCLLACIALCSPTGALAKDSPVAKTTEDRAMIAKARQLYEEGLSAYKKERWAEACAAFVAAWSLHRHWQIAGSLARCEMQLGRDRDAAEHAAYFARNAPSAWQERALGLLKETRTKVAAVKVEVNVEGAEVRVDGEVIGTAPLSNEVFVEPGKRTIEASRKGYEDAREEVEAKAGGALEVALRLEPPAPAAVAAPVSVKNPPPPPPPAARPLWPMIVSGGAAAVLLGAGIGLTVVANGKTADVEALLEQVGGRSGCTGKPTGNLAETCTELHSAVVGHDTFSNAAMVSFIVGSSLALGTAGLSVWTWRPRPSVTVQTAPIMGKSHGGIVVTGAW